MESSVRPVIGIPVYKDFEDWGHSEIRSFYRCVTVLQHHPIFLIGPKKLNWELLKKNLYLQFDFQASVDVFDNQYFEDIVGYNKLLKSTFFYKRFRNYSHLLIYQLDAYVFKDELIFWCKKDYDYIGAPWLEGFVNNSAIKFIGVGNGGFSLRNIDSALKVLPKINFLHGCLQFLERKDNYFINNTFKRFIKYSIIRRYLGVDNLSSFMKLRNTDNIFEDFFWGVLVPSVFKNYKVASTEEAIGFSFEVNPRLLFEKNNNKLPFGCHAWLKYDPVFWEKFVS